MSIWSQAEYQQGLSTNMNNNTPDCINPLLSCFQWMLMFSAFSVRGNENVRLKVTDAMLVFPLKFHIKCHVTFKLFITEAGRLANKLAVRLHVDYSLEIKKRRL